MWKVLDGYYWPYRINEDGRVERQWDDDTWRLVKPFIRRIDKNGAYGKLSVRMRIPNGAYRNVTVKKLMVNAFLGGEKPGMAYTFRNGMFTDCSLANLYSTDLDTILRQSGGQNRRSVEKVDREGNVIDLYASVSEAARKNHYTTKAIRARCRNQVVDPYDQDGHTYRYEDCDRDERMERKRYYTNVIEKVDRDGNVVEVYPSMAEAVRQNDMGRKAIQRRCDGLFEGDPFKAIGYTFRYRELKGD